MKVTVNMPDKVWAALAVRADARGIKVPELLLMAVEDAATRPVGGRPRSVITPHVEARITELVERRNMSIPEVARELGLNRDTVASAAKRIGVRTLRTERKAS